MIILSCQLVLIINLYVRERERERERAHMIASYIPLIWIPNPVGIQFKEKKIMIAYTEQKSHYLILIILLSNITIGSYK